MNAPRAIRPLHSGGNPRRLILVDIENFNGQAVQSPVQIEWCKRTLVSWLNIQYGEIVVIASDKGSFWDVNVGWEEARVLMGMGADGADLRLVEEIENMNVGRFDEIALVSGDGIFAEPVARAAELGMPTKVYSHGSVLSKRLRFAATEVYLSEDRYSRNTPQPVTVPTMSTNIIQLRPNTKEAA